MKEVIEPVKSKSLFIRVTPEEHKKIKRAAQKARLSMSEYMRRAEKEKRDAGKGLRIIERGGASREGRP